MKGYQRKWGWVGVLLLVLVLFGSHRSAFATEDIFENVITDIVPPSIPHQVPVKGYIIYEGAQLPTLSARFINVSDRTDVYGMAVIATQWSFPRPNKAIWQVTIDYNDVPPGEYFVEVTATYPNRAPLVDSSEDIGGGAEPECWQQSACSNGGNIDG